MKYEFDAAHSQVEFTVKHMMVTTVRGHFNKFSGDLDIDEQNPAASSVDVTIDVASIDTGQEARDNHLRSPDFFDVARFPTITYKSTKVEPLGGGKYHVTGDLTIHGVTKPHTLEITPEGPITNPYGKQVIGFDITTKISRKEFGLEWNVALESGGWLVSDEVKIFITAEVTAAASAAA